MSTIRPFSLVFVLLSFLGSSHATAQSTTTAPSPAKESPVASSLEDGALLLAIWNARGDDLSAFNADFLAAVPANQLKAIIADAHATYGEARCIEAGEAENRWNLLTDDYQVPLDLVRDDDGLVAGLLLKTPIKRDIDLASALQALTASDAVSSWLLLRNGEFVDSRNADIALAVGSAFKLHVLDAFREADAAGRLSRDDVVVLQDVHRSWPSGILQDWPVGTPLTLATVAQLMISVSDNTATDMLIDVLGRETVEATSPYRPLMTTSELFRLKLAPDLAKRYSTAKEDERRQLLEEIAGIDLPALDRLPSAPLPGNEWYTTVEELCAVIERVADEPAFLVNAGLATDGDWSAVAYQGGSEAGVLNMTHRLVAEDGTVWCLAATWNGEPGDDGRLVAIDADVLQSSVAGAIAALRRE